MKVEQLLNEATDVKGAVAHVQNIFDKAGLVIKVMSKGKSDLICRGSINRTKFMFTIQNLDGKINVIFNDFEVNKIAGLSVFNTGAGTGSANLSKPRDLASLMKQTRSFAITADNSIAEIRAAKVFLARLTRCLSRIAGSIEK